MKKSIPVKRKPIKCPKCSHRPVAEILYGEPFFSMEMEQKITDGKLVLGGCCIVIGEEQAKWHCTNCETDFCKAT